MRMMLCLSAAVATAITTACAPVTSSGKRTPVEVWRAGDDGLTSRFRDAVEAAFVASPSFTPSSGKRPSTLIVTIPTDVQWKRSGDRNQVLYSIEFASVGGQHLGSITGSCWDDLLSECADRVLKEAVIAARRMP